MTAQVSDALLYDGKEYQLLCEPLEAYFEQHPPRPKIEATCTACWRGYVAFWRINKSRLYLDQIQDFDGAKMNLKSRLFPAETGPVFASWFTGPLICPNGAEKEYIHMGYATIYEQYLIIEIANGLVTGISDLSLDAYQHWQKEYFS